CEIDVYLSDPITFRFTSSACYNITYCYIFLQIFSALQHNVEMFQILIVIILFFLLNKISKFEEICDKSELKYLDDIEPQCGRKYDLLLLGKTGNGKSSTGNSILGYKAFVASAKSTSVTNGIERKSNKFKDTILNVVDTPGVLDTAALYEVVNGSTTRKIIQQLQEAVEINPRGYNACILVAKYGNRFTKEESDAIHMLKQIFGEDFMRHFCVLVMTNGDTFEAEENDFTFREWLYRQSGSINDVFHECGFRVVLFDNLTKDPKKK
ncbi:unnamed protein product, partial [Lymnaea stagnalis]